MTTPLDDDRHSASLDLGDEETPHECQARVEFLDIAAISHELQKSSIPTGSGNRIPLCYLI